jgi:hypothetical protein
MVVILFIFIMEKFVNITKLLIIPLVIGFFGSLPAIEKKIQEFKSSATFSGNYNEVNYVTVGEEFIVKGPLTFQRQVDSNAVFDTTLLKQISFEARPEYRSNWIWYRFKAEKNGKAFIQFKDINGIFLKPYYCNIIIQ